MNESWKESKQILEWLRDWVFDLRWMFQKFIKSHSYTQTQIKYNIAEEDEDDKKKSLTKILY